MLMELANRAAGWPAILTALAVLIGPPAQADVSAELLDIAARIEYGFYTEDDRAIQAARVGLQQLGRPTLLSTYYDALAAYRLAQLTWFSGNKGAGRWLDECEEGARAAEKLDRPDIDSGNRIRFDTLSGSGKDSRHSTWRNETSHHRW